MPTVNFEISNDLLYALNENENQLSQKMRLYAALQLYNEHKLSMGQAAKLAGLDKHEFMWECSNHNIDVINYDANEFKQELKSFNQ